ncbi:proline rich transmembrane protein 1B-like isoform X2 [Watersipora subatra]|uniref:proline rich transmembrane protein 1B-like isoform X2 n=1 Tax=Watersipora subatra TaxID=2589382 RepID=UPI00355B41DB
MSQSGSRQLHPQKPVVTGYQQQPTSQEYLDPMVVPVNPVYQVVYPATVQQQPAHPPNDFLILSIFTTICCCFCLGVPAIVLSSQVKAAIREGDHARAAKASYISGVLNVVGITVGIIATGIYSLFFVYFLVLYLQQ